MRYRNGMIMAENDKKSGKLGTLDYIGGVPDSGTPHAIGYANKSGIHFARPFIKYTPTWPRSFMPANQKDRKKVAKMKLVPVHELIVDKDLLFVDDSIVRGTQLSETVDFLYDNGAKSVHIRSACPPIMYSCKYLNFTRSDVNDLITRKVIAKLEGEDPDSETLKSYADPDSEKYKKMVEMIGEELHFTSLKYHRLDDMIEATGLPEEKLCTYCWTGNE